MGKFNSIAKQIRIQKKQDRNRMVGQTFNPSGHTSESLDLREKNYIKEINSMSEQQQLEIYLSFKEIDEMKEKNNIHYSNSFEHNVFIRNFYYKFDK